MNFNPFEDAMDPIGVAMGELLGIGLGLKLQDQQAASLVGQGAGKDDSPLPVEWFEMSQMSRSVDLPSGLSIGAVVADDDEFHTVRS